MTVQPRRLDELSEHELLERCMRAAFAQGKAVERGDERAATAWRGRAITLRALLLERLATTAPQNAPQNAPRPAPPRAGLPVVTGGHPDPDAETTDGGTSVEARALALRDAMRTRLLLGELELTERRLIRLTEWSRSSVRRAIGRALERGWIGRRNDGRRNLYGVVGGPESWSGT